MSIPTGYEKLAVIGIAWKGEYAQGTAYKTMNGVYYKGSTYVALRDNPTGPPAADGANWQYLAKGFEQQLLSAITALDTSGVLGEAGASVGGQALMDAIADKVMTKLVERSSIVQTESTDTTTVPSSAYFKQVTDRVISDFGDLNENTNLLAHGLSPTDYDLLNWATDNPFRRQIWKITDRNMTGTPDDTKEWCCLNFQDSDHSRGVIMAIEYGMGTRICTRIYYNKEWLTEWASLRN